MKSQQKHIFYKSFIHEMEDSIEMRPKGLLRVHLKLSKKSKNTLLGSKLKEICIVKVSHFWKIVKSQQCPKLHLLSNGPNFLCLHLTSNMVHDQNTLPHVIGFIYLIYFYFNHLKIKLNQINNQNNERFYCKYFSH